MKIDLINEDCMRVMARYPDGYFDLAIVDPPYGAKCDVTQGKSGTRSHGKGWRQDRYTPKIDTWNQAPEAEYYEQLFRVSKNQIIWGGNYFTDYLEPTSSWLVWNKGQRGFTLSDGELAWTSFGGALRIVDISRANANRSRFSDHPHEKPVDLYAWIYSKHGFKGCSVIDTHLGSGSNAIAAYQYGVGSFVGIELDAGYYERAKKSINQAMQQQKLFEESTPKQQGIF